MLQIVVLNMSKKNDCNLSSFEEKFFSESGLCLNTCLRHLCILKESDYLENEDKLNKTNYKIFKGYEALNYAVQILSGLESPVLGETEVLGQFREQVLPQLEKKPDFQEPVQFILKMVKNIRTKHFVGQGAQTYGGLVRKLLKSDDEVVFIGAGSFAESIYPWLKPHKEIFFSVRNPNKYSEHKLFVGSTFLKVSEDLNHQKHQTSEPKSDKSISLVICAPLTAVEIKKHIGDVKIANVIDFRETSKADPLVLSDPTSKVFILEEVFTEISNALENKTKILNTVSKEIEDSINEQLTKHRPFGWDDIYAH